MKTLLDPLFNSILNDVFLIASFTISIILMYQLVLYIYCFLYKTEQSILSIDSSTSADKPIKKNDGGGTGFSGDSSSSHKC